MPWVLVSPFYLPENPQKGVIDVAKVKKLPGKTAAKEASASVYKPSIYLDHSQIPKELAGADVGKTVNLTVKAKLVRRTEESSGPSSVCLELQSIGIGGAPKPARGGKAK